MMGDTTDEMTSERDIGLPMIKRGDEGATHDKNGTESVRQCKHKEEGTHIWSNKMEFYLTTVSTAVGMGNLWRFPYQCYRNGGGAFLIPLILMVLFLGFPVMCMELALGQYTRSGPVAAWRKLSPIYEGIGWASVVVCAIGMPYYVCLMAYGMFYLFASFSSELPWATCNHHWNTAACKDSATIRLMDNCSSSNGTWYGGQCLSTHNLTVWNGTLTDINPRSPSDEYFHRYVLGISSGITDVGGIQWHLALCLILAWVLVVVGLSFDSRSWGKISYVTGLLPYAILLTLLIRGLTQEGSLQGVVYFLNPEWSRLAHAQVWADAAVQAFFSLAISWGGLIIIGSHNKYRNNCFRDAAVVSAMDLFSSLLCGLVIFAILGHMSHELDVPLDKVVGQGAGLAFVVYTEAVTTMPAAQLWSVLFMLMLIFLGLGSAIPGIANVQSAMELTFPNLLNTRIRKFLSLVTICVTSYIVGLIFVTKGGIYLIQLFDTYGPPYALLVIGASGTVALMWIYGVRRFSKDLADMVGFRPPIFIQFCWMIMVPAGVVFVILFFLIGFQPMKYADYVFPFGAEIFGLCLTLLEIGVIPGIAIIVIVTAEKTQGKSIMERLKYLLRPQGEWYEKPDDNGNKDTHQPLQSIRKKQYDIGEDGSC